MAVRPAGGFARRCSRRAAPGGSSRRPSRGHSHHPGGPSSRTRRRRRGHEHRGRRRHPAGAEPRHPPRPHQRADDRRSLRRSRPEHAAVRSVGPLGFGGHRLRDRSWPVPRCHTCCGCPGCRRRHAPPDRSSGRRVQRPRPCPAQHNRARPDDRGRRLRGRVTADGGRPLPNGARLVARDEGCPSPEPNVRR